MDGQGAQEGSVGVYVLRGSGGAGAVECRRTRGGQAFAVQHRGVRYCVGLDAAAGSADATCPVLCAGSGACARRLRVTQPNSFPEHAVAAHNE